MSRGKPVKTDIFDDGRVCTRCSKRKLWSEFRKATNSSLGYTSICKNCLNADAKKKTNYTKEREYSKNKRKRDKQQDPWLFLARRARGSLLARAKKENYNGEIASLEELKTLFKEKSLCYYSKIELIPFSKDRNKLPSLDHKQPVSRNGKHNIENLCVCSSTMNNAKGNLNEQEFNSLLALISSWEDKGVNLIKRLKQGHF